MSKLSLVFHSSFKQRCPLSSSYLVGRMLSIGFIEFFVFDSDSFPDLLFFSGLGFTFPLVAFDKIKGATFTHFIL